MARRARARTRPRAPSWRRRPACSSTTTAAPAPVRASAEPAPASPCSLGVDGGCAVFAADPGPSAAPRCGRQASLVGAPRRRRDVGARRREPPRPRGRPAQLAPPPPVLRELRRRRPRASRPATCALPELRRAAPPAHRPGRDHARDRRRPRPARPQRELARAALLRLAGFVEPGESLEEAVAREVARGGRRRGRRRALRLVAAVAVPGVADARLRGAAARAATPTPRDGELERRALVLGRRPARAPRRG